MAEMLNTLAELAPGVRGYTVDCGERGVYIPFVMAATPGSGDVSRYLDSLPRDRRVVFPTVMSRRLAEMLIRRGFVPGAEWSDEFGEMVEILERPGGRWGRGEVR